MTFQKNMLKFWKAVWIPLTVFVLWTGGACDKKNPGEPDDTPADTTHVSNSLEIILYDCYAQAHEGRPHGVDPGTLWSQHPVIDKPGTPPEGWTAFTGWGQIYEWIEGNPAKNVRVEIANMQTYMLRMYDQTWYQLQDSDVDGSYYYEDFHDDLSERGDIRREPNGNISVVPGNGFNFHFWPEEGRVTIPNRQVEGVYITFQTRLILDDPDGPDERSNARFLSSAGGDYWLSLTAAWDNWETNGGVGVGRFKFITNEWVASNCCTLPADKIRSNPPPPFNETAKD